MAPKGFCLNNAQGTAIPCKGSPFLYLELWISMARQTSEGMVCRSTCLQNQHGALGCPPPLDQPPHMGSCTLVLLECQSAWGNWVLTPLLSPPRSSSHSSQPGATGNTLNGNLRKVFLQAKERLDLDELSLQRLEGWPEQEQNQARKLLTRWKYLFSYSNLDLGNTFLIKHQIKLTDWMPFKVCYQGIPPLCKMTWRPISRRCWT